jgi:hypothetical protein
VGQIAAVDRVRFPIPSWCKQYREHQFQFRSNYLDRLDTTNFPQNPEKLMSYIETGCRWKEANIARQNVGQIAQPQPVLHHTQPIN